MAKKDGGPPKGRRYIGGKETIGYIMFDWAGGFDIGDMGEVFLSRVLNLDLGMRALIDTFIKGPWDVINDLWFATAIDKTRTRFGKFRPYLFLSLLAGVPFKMFYYIMPFLFWGTPPAYGPKLVAYAVLAVLSEASGTFNQFSSAGMLATITPDMYERTRLITLNNFVQNFTMKKLPAYIFDAVVTYLNFSGLEDGATLLKLRSVCLIFGVGTASLAALAAIYFALVARERVPQSIDQPSLRDSVKAILQNKPLLIITLTRLFGTFNIGGDGEYTYYQAVLKFPLGTTVAGIPGAVTGFLVYPYIPWARERFSTRALWLVGSHVRPMLGIAVYFLGLINNNFTNIWVILPIIAIWEATWTPLLKMRDIVERDLLNECMDYGEWKTGQRDEAKINALAGVAGKISSYLFNGINIWLRSKIGFKTGIDYTNQPLHVQRFVWGMFTFFPAVTGNILSMIPKFFYNISKQDRERMYEDLKTRRATLSREITDAVQEVEPVHAP